MPGREGVNHDHYIQLIFKFSDNDVNIKKKKLGKYPFPSPFHCYSDASLLFPSLILGKPQKTDMYPDSVSTAGSQVIRLFTWRQ